jgi:hypothetical protein
MHLLRFFPTLAALLLLTSCGDSGQHFEKPPPAAVAALKAAQFPTILFGRQIRKSRTFEEGGTVIIALLGKDDDEKLRIAATIAPDGTGSRVETELRPPVGGSAIKGLDTDSMNGFAKEFVAATMEGRSFDLGFGGPLYGSKVSQMAGDAAIEMSKTEDEAQEPPAEEADSPEPAFGQPMMRPAPTTR